MKKGAIEDGVVYHAGFPNAGEDDRMGPSLGIESLLVKHRASTYLWRLDSQGIAGFGWKPKSIVVVDRAVPFRHGDTVVAVVEEAFVARKIEKRGSSVRYVTPDGRYESMDGTVVWGVVTYVVMGIRP